MFETQALIGAVMQILHPKQYAVGRQVLDRLVATPPYQEAASLWPSPFTTMQVTSNRWAPLHRDRGSTYGSFDLLATVGEFEGGRMNFRTLPLDFAQDAGSILAFCSRLLPHEVEPFKGTRTSFAWVTKEDMAMWVKAPLVPFCSEKRVVKACMPQ